MSCTPETEDPKLAAIAENSYDGGKSGPLSGLKKRALQAQSPEPSKLETQNWKLTLGH